MSHELKRALLVVIGTVVALSGLWGGAYVMYHCAAWANFPALLTGVFLFVLGGHAVIFGITGSYK